MKTEVLLPRFIENLGRFGNGNLGSYSVEHLWCLSEWCACVGVGEYFFYAIFNWLSPFMTLIFAAFRIKIRQLAGAKVAS